MIIKVLVQEVNLYHHWHWGVISKEDGLLLELELVSEVIGNIDNIITKLYSIYIATVFQSFTPLIWYQLLLLIIIIIIIIISDIGPQKD